jgi:hypothetical protein
MAKSITSLPRLNNTEGLMEWSRELIDELQRVFLGSGAGFIDGDAILDGSLGTDKLLATAGGLWSGAQQDFNPGGPYIIALPNVWVSSGGVVLSNNMIFAPNFNSWAHLSFYCHFVSANAVSTQVQLQESDDGGANWFARAMWTGGIPVDCNISMVLFTPANARFRMTITNSDTAVKSIGGPAALFTMGIIGQSAEPT